MRHSLLPLLLALATPLSLGAQQQQAADPSRPAVAAARASWSTAHTYIVRSAEQMSEADFGFRPVATVRTFAQIVAHVADDETGWCAQILGEPLKQTQYEKTLTTKADVVKAIRDAGAYCEKAYTMTDAQAAALTTIWGGQQPKIKGLVDNAAHDWEHYGNIVTYLRIKGMVPPSSQSQ
jgi:uncharacterized damage-inducible protein DinB